MTEEAKVYDVVCEIVTTRFGVEEEELNPETSISDLGADSLDLVELIMEIEDHYNMQFENKTIAELKTVGDIVEYIEGTQAD